MLPDRLDALGSRLRPYRAYFLAASILGPLGCILVAFAADFVPDRLTTTSLFFLAWFTACSGSLLVAALFFGEGSRIPRMLRWVAAIFWVIYSAAAVFIPALIWFH